MVIIENKGTNTLVVHEMYGVFNVDENGNEGLFALHTRDGQMPLVGADLARVDSMVGVLKQNMPDIEKALGHPLKWKVLKFSTREDITANYK